MVTTRWVINIWIVVNIWIELFRHKIVVFHSGFIHSLIDIWNVADHKNQGNRKLSLILTKNPEIYLMELKDRLYYLAVQTVSHWLIIRVILERTWHTLVSIFFISIASVNVTKVKFWNFQIISILLENLLIIINK